MFRPTGIGDDGGCCGEAGRGVNLTAWMGDVLAQCNDPMDHEWALKLCWLVCLAALPWIWLWRQQRVRDRHMSKLETIMCIAVRSRGRREGRPTFFDGQSPREEERCRLKRLFSRINYTVVLDTSRESTCILLFKTGLAKPSRSLLMLLPLCNEEQS